MQSKDQVAARAASGSQLDFRYARIRLIRSHSHSRSSFPPCNARSTSRRMTSLFRLSRLSCSFFPRASPRVTLARPRVKCRSRGPA